MLTTPRANEYIDCQWINTLSKAMNDAGLLDRQAKADITKIKRLMSRGVKIKFAPQGKVFQYFNRVKIAQVDVEIEE